MGRRKSTGGAEVGLAEEALPACATDVKNHRRKSLARVGREEGSRKVVPHARDEKVAALVAEYVGNGADLNDIAFALNIRPGQVKKYYGDELRSGAFRANMEVATAMKKMAKEDPAAGKFWLKARAGWKDGENSGQQTSPLQINIHT